MFFLFFNRQKDTQVTIPLLKTVILFYKILEYCIKISVRQCCWICWSCSPWSYGKETHAWTLQPIDSTGKGQLKKCIIKADKASFLIYDLFIVKHVQLWVTVRYFGAPVGWPPPPGASHILFLHGSTSCVVLRLGKNFFHRVHTCSYF